MIIGRAKNGDGIIRSNTASKLHSSEGIKLKKMFLYLDSVIVYLLEFAAHHPELLLPYSPTAGISLNRQWARLAFTVIPDCRYRGRTKRGIER